MKPLVKTYESGNGVITTSVSEGQEWEGGNHKRIYFEVETVKGDFRKGLVKLYQVVEGHATGMDLSVIVDGIEWGYKCGGFVNSSKKNMILREIVREFAKDIMSASKEDKAGEKEPEVKKVSKGSVMKRAWEIAKAAVISFGGKVKDYFAQSLKAAWQEAKA